MALGTNLVLLPLHRPVDLAEQVPLIDIACGGRFIMTVGQGYRPEEFTAMGVPFEDRLARFVDGVAILRRLVTEDRVSHDSGWWSMDKDTVLPRPAQPGGVPIWVGATTDRAIKRAGRIDDASMALGMTHLAMRVSWPGSNPEHTMECIELLGTQVLPRVRTELS